MDGFASPDSYVDFGFYYLIASSLQRRVWAGPEHAPIYGNIYVILTGEPGVGKGLVIKQVANFLKHHKLPDPREKYANAKPVTDIDPSTQKAIFEAEKTDYNNAMKVTNPEADKDDSKAKFHEKPLLYPVAADATTYEALVRTMSRSIRFKSVEQHDPKTDKKVIRPYAHSSLCFCLEEISSLFRKRTEDLVHFLIQAYDCGDYEYDTKTQGKDRIKQCCLNFFGGTTPGFMQASFNDSLISEGFSSRTFFIFEAKNRERPFWPPPLSKEQEQNRNNILAHIGKLANLYGPVTFTPEADERLKHWWEVETNYGNKRPNVNLKLAPYYGRKKVHLVKMAMAHHFGDSTDMMIGLKSVEYVMNVLAFEEKKMHYCLGLDNANPLARCAVNVQKLIASNGKEFTFSELKAEFWNSLPGTSSEDRSSSMREILEHLEITGQIRKETRKHQITNENCIFYGALQKSTL